MISFHTGAVIMCAAKFCETPSRRVGLPDKKDICALRQERKLWSSAHAGAPIEMPAVFFLSSQQLFLSVHCSAFIVCHKTLRPPVATLTATEKRRQRNRTKLHTVAVDQRGEMTVEC